MFLMVYQKRRRRLHLAAAAAAAAVFRRDLALQSHGAVSRGEQPWQLGGIAVCHRWGELARDLAQLLPDLIAGLSGKISGPDIARKAQAVRAQADARPSH